MTLMQILGVIGLGVVLFTVAKHLDFNQLFTSRMQQHLVFGATASVFFLWIFRAGIYDGLSVHFLWLTALTLTLGVRWSIIAATVALLGVTGLGYERWEMMGINALLGIVVPIGLTHLIYNLSFHRLPRNLFLYIFVCAFFPGALMIAIKMFLLGGYLSLIHI